MRGWLVGSCIDSCIGSRGTCLMVVPDGGPLAAMVQPVEPDDHGRRPTCPHARGRSYCGEAVSCYTTCRLFPSAAGIHEHSSHRWRRTRTRARLEDRGEPA